MSNKIKRCNKCSEDFGLGFEDTGYYRENYLIINNKEYEVSNDTYLLGIWLYGLLHEMIKTHVSKR